MAHYTLQVSNHPRAGERPAPQIAVDSWKLIYDGPIATTREAREAVDKLAIFYRHAQAFRWRSRASALGKLWYEIVRPAPGCPA